MKTSKPKYPEIVVKLSDANDNVFNLINICYQAMEENGIYKEERHAFIIEVTSSKSYDEAKTVMRQWVNVI